MQLNSILKEGQVNVLFSAALQPKSVLKPNGRMEPIPAATWEIINKISSININSWTTARGIRFLQKHLPFFQQEV